MKKNIYFWGLVISAIFVSCNGNTSKQTAETEKPVQEQVAEQEVKAIEKVETIFGQYEFKDANNSLWIITINEDKTATAQKKNSDEVFKGSLQNYKEYPMIAFTPGGSPKIAFKNNLPSVLLILRDKRVFNHHSACDANDEKLGLEISKIQK